MRLDCNFHFCILFTPQMAESLVNKEKLLSVLGNKYQDPEFTQGY